jgi:RecB family endonuclease NucS
LANFLNKKYPTSDNEKLRPDFICANNKADLVIVELKRPSHEINTDDIVQLQNYLVAVDEYGKYTDKRGFIIGKSISDHNQKLIDSTTKNIEFKSYVKLVDDCRRRYQEYLDAIEKAA